MAWRRIAKSMLLFCLRTLWPRTSTWDCHTTTCNLRCQWELPLFGVSLEIWMQDETGLHSLSSGSNHVSLQWSSKTPTQPGHSQLKNFATHLPVWMTLPWQAIWLPAKRGPFRVKIIRQFRTYKTHQNPVCIPLVWCVLWHLANAASLWKRLPLWFNTWTWSDTLWLFWLCWQSQPTSPSPTHSAS